MPGFWLSARINSTTRQQLSHFTRRTTNFDWGSDEEGIEGVEGDRGPDPALDPESWWLQPDPACHLQHRPDALESRSILCHPSAARVAKSGRSAMTALPLSSASIANAAQLTWAWMGIPTLFSRQSSQGQRLRLEATLAFHVTDAAYHPYW